MSMTTRLRFLGAASALLLLSACSSPEAGRIKDYVEEDALKLDYAKSYYDQAIMPVLKRATITSKIERVYRSSDGYAVEASWGWTFDQPIEDIAQALSQWLNVEPIGSSLSNGFCISTGQNPDGRKAFPYSRTLLQHIVRQGAVAAKLELIVERPWWQGGDNVQEAALVPIASLQHGDRFCVRATNGTRKIIPIRNYSAEAVLKLRGTDIFVPFIESTKLQDRASLGGAMLYQNGQSPGRAASGAKTVN